MESTKPRTWQLQVAKNRFSELVDEAAKAPQIVTRHGKEAAVVLSIEAYRALTGKKKATRSFTEFLLSAPKLPLGLEVERDKSSGRKVEFE
ncbi:MAG: type II toxin-antitoxin system Phd/YefM family antitoxin [Polyangiaceae bacterium]|nr:type II toxin-antitoxin system Phd/YefM family antitoxin [Polyangiaceae bacterium]